MTQRYGTRRVDRMWADINALRQVITREGTPAIQEAWDRVEPCIDYAYGGCPNCRDTHGEAQDRADRHLPVLRHDRDV